MNEHGVRHLNTRAIHAQALLLWMGIGHDGDQVLGDVAAETDNSPSPVKSLLHATTDGRLHTSFGRTVSFRSGADLVQIRPKRLVSCS